METRKLAAYHKAGHVVASLHFDIGFEYVTIRETDETVGRVVGCEVATCQHRPRPFSFGERGEVGVTRDDLEAELIYALAGEAATFTLTGDRDEIGSRIRTTRSRELPGVVVVANRELARGPMQWVRVQDRRRIARARDAHSRRVFRSCAQGALVCVCWMKTDTARPSWRTRPSVSP